MAHLSSWSVQSFAGQFQAWASSWEPTRSEFKTFQMFSCLFTINENGKPVENPNLFEGDLFISPEEIELYYGKPSSKHVNAYEILN